MNGINWGNMNPYSFVPQYQAPQMHIIRVQGENGVDAFQMGPNSDVLLLDETAPIIWFVQTDGAGYKSKTPYNITVHEKEPSIMDQRFDAIDKRLKSLEEALLDESDS